MAWRLIGDNPLFGLILAYYKLKPQEEISIKFNQNAKMFVDENPFENIVCAVAAVIIWHKCITLHAAGECVSIPSTRETYTWLVAS